jgi:flagellin-specific chaperone FliS
LVLGQLEDWIDLEHGGELAQNLSRFYAYLRAKMMDASIAKSATMLEAQMELILHVRTTWQQRDMAASQSSKDVTTQPIATASSSDSDRAIFSRSA